MKVTRSILTSVGGDWTATVLDDNDDVIFTIRGATAAEVNERKFWLAEAIQSDDLGLCVYMIDHRDSPLFEAWKAQRNPGFAAA